MAVEAWHAERRAVRAEHWDGNGSLGRRMRLNFFCVASTNYRAREAATSHSVKLREPSEDEYAAAMEQAIAEAKARIAAGEPVQEDWPADHPVYPADNVTRFAGDVRLSDAIMHGDSDVGEGSMEFREAMVNGSLLGGSMADCITYPLRCAVRGCGGVAVEGDTYCRQCSEEEDALVEMAERKLATREARLKRRGLTWVDLALFGLFLSFVAALGVTVGYGLAIRWGWVR